MAFGTKAKLIMSVIFLSFTFITTAFSQAVTYYSQDTDNFSTLSNWTTEQGGGGTNPSDLTTGDIFVIQNGDVITLDNVATAILGLTIESGGTFNNSSNTLIFGASPGLLDIQSGGTYTASTGTIEHNAGLLNDVTIQATAATSLNNVTTNGRLTFSGNVQFTINGIFNYRANEDLTLNGSTTLVYGGSATLKYDFTGSKTIADEWQDGTTIPNVILTSGDVTIPTATTRTVGTKLTRVSGTITESGTGVLAYSATGSTLEYNPGADVNVADEWPASNGPENVTVNNSGFTVTSSSARTVPKILTLTAGTISCSGNTLTVLGDVTGSDVAGSGIVASNTPLSMGDGANSAEDQTISGAITLNTLIINKDTNADIVQLTGSLSFTGTTPALTVSQGIFDANGRNISNSYTLSVANGATFQTGGSSLSGTTLSLATGSIFNYTGTGESIIAGTYSNITISNNPTQGASLIGAITVNGTLTINSGSIINLQNETITKGGSSSLVVAGTLYTDGTDIRGFNSYDFTSGAVRFNGDGTGTEEAPATTYNFLRINNSDGLTLAGNVTVTGTLSFAAGTITSTTSNLLTLGASATASASGTSFVTGPVARITNNSATSFTFPLGFGSNLRALTLSFDAAPDGGGNTITAEAKGTATGATSSDPDIISVETDGYWTVTTTAVNDVNDYTATFTTNGFSPAITTGSSVTLVKGTLPNFDTQGTSESSGTNTVTARFADGFSDFAIGNISTSFTWDGGGDGFTWNDGFNWVSDAVPNNGDVIVIPAGSFNVIYNAPTTTTYASVTVGSGNLLSFSSGTFDLTTTVLNVSSNAQVTFAGTNVTNYTSGNTNYAAGSTVRFNGGASGAVRADDYANLIISGATGGSGIANVSEDIEINSGSFDGTIVLNGSSSQDISGSSVVFSGLTLNNSNGFTLSDEATVNGTLTLTNGVVDNGSTVLTVGAGGTISGGSSSSYISGPLAITGVNTAKTYPIGDSNYRPVYTNLTSGGTPVVQFQVFDTAPNNSFNAPLLAISSVRHFLGTASGAALTGGNLTISYGDDDGVSNFDAQGDVVVARSVNNTTYSSLGGESSGSTPSGTVTSTAGVGTSLGYFTLGTETGDNSLPVEMAAFAATPEFDKVTINWKTASEVENLGFNIYRQISGEDSWNQMNEEMIAGRGNYSGETNYEFVDNAVVAGQTYIYKLESVSINGVINVEKTVELQVPVPTEYVLFKNYPNPFNPTTNLKFQLPEYSKVSINIYDMSGRLVKTLLNNATYNAGQHVVSWDATNQFGTKVSSGVYIYRFNAGSFSELGRMILLK